MDRTTKRLRDSLSEQTISEAIEKLETYGVCNVIRPTGFGKSFMLAKISSSRKNGKYRYKKCLYVYPLDVIKQDVSTQYRKGEKVSLHNTEFMSYRMLDMKNKDGSLTNYLKDFDIVMLDECHTCGSEGFREAWENIAVLFGPDKKHVIGVTASPYRMDSFDVIGEILGGERCSVFKFDVLDAYETNLMIRPLYIRAVYDKVGFSDSLREEYKEQCSDKKEERELETLINKIEGAEKIIYKHLKKYAKQYMKFIVFYIDKNDMINKKDMVRGWFEEIYPNKDINEYNIVSSGFGNEEDNLEVENNISGRTEIHKISALNNLGHKKIESESESVAVDNSIDIVNCIDMLNMGYHVDDITGIIMLRGTRSQIVYTQQLGRCQSVNAKRQAIIFDFVNNCNAKFWFKNENNNKDSKFTSEGYERERKQADGEDFIVKDGIDAVDAFIQKISNRKVYNKGVQIDRLRFWYTRIKSPLYIMSILNDAEPDKIEKALNINNIDVDFEDKLYRVIQGDKIAKANFEFLRTEPETIDRKLKIKKEFIQLKLSKRIKEAE